MALDKFLVVLDQMNLRRTAGLAPLLAPDEAWHLKDPPVGYFLLLLTQAKPYLIGRMGGFDNMCGSAS